MPLKPLAIFELAMPLINQFNILTVLIIVIVVFLFLLILGIRKSYKLKKDNERLNNLSASARKESETYKDFTEGHMYK